MYLFLADQSFISSQDYLDIKEQLNDDAGIVLCYSGSTLLNIAEKLTPDTIIVDFNLIEIENYSGFFKSLRSLNEKAYIMVLIDRVDYDNLLVSIEQGGIDEYMVKPVNKDDFIARIHMASRRKGFTGEGSDEAFVEGEEENLSLSFDSLENAEDAGETSVETDYSEDAFLDPDQETAYDRDIFKDDITSSEVEDRFTKVFGDDLLNNTEELSAGKDEIPDEFLAEFEPNEHDTDQFFEIAEQENEQGGKYPFEQFLLLQEGKPQPELPGLNDELFQYERYEKFNSAELRAGRRSKKKKPAGSGPNGVLALIGNVLLVFVLIIMAVVSFILILDKVSESVPQVAGYQVYVIKSDNMSPEIAAGSIAFGRQVEAEQIAAGDIITFRSGADPATLTAGRVVELNREDGLNLIIRSDANAIADSDPLPAEAVIGRLIGSVPYIGYLVDYAQTREGLILLIFIPGLLIIIFQLGKIVKHFSKQH